MEQNENKVEEFFLKNFDTDRLFDSVKRADYMFLYYINICKKNSQSKQGVYLAELADAMKLPVNHISNAVKQLQDKGLVVWDMNKDRDKTYVDLTGNAVKLMDEQRARLKKAYAMIQERVSQDELFAMAETMKKIRKVFEEA